MFNTSAYCHLEIEQIKKEKTRERMCGRKLNSKATISYLQESKHKEEKKIREYLHKDKRYSV